MERFFKLAFPALMLCLLFSVVGVKVATLAGADLPAWAGVGADRSLLEGRRYQAFPEITADSLLDGVFQDSFEQYVSDLVPRRDDALMLNAGVQRAAIAAAAACLSYDAYPTFYGSDYVYCKPQDAVMPMPWLQDDDVEAIYARAAEAVNAGAARFEGKPVVFMNVDRPEFSAQNPAARLMASTVDDGYVREAFLSKLSGGIDVIDFAIGDEVELWDGYFRSDHHWTIDRAYEAYAATLAALNPAARPVEVEGWTRWDVAFYGSRSRAGLCDVGEPDRIVDIDYAQSDLRVVYDGEEVDAEALAHRGMYGSGGESGDRHANRYGEYFHGDPGLLEIDNLDLDDGETLLIIGDSYTNCIERLFAEHYSTVYCVDPRNYGGDIDDLDAEIGLSGVDAVLFLISGTNYTGDAFAEFFLERP